MLHFAESSRYHEPSAHYRIVSMEPAAQRSIANWLHWLPLWLFLPAVVWTAGCGPRPAPPPLEVEYAGCAEVLKGPVCVLRENHTLRLWIPTQDAQISVGGGEVDGGERTEVVIQDAEEVDGGRRLTVVVPEGADRLAVWVRKPSAEASWELPLAPAGLAPSPSSTRAAELVAAGNRAFRKRNADFDQAAESFAAARAAYAADGRWLTETQTAATLVFCRLQQYRFVEARRVLESMTLGPQAPAEARFYKSYSQGTAAVATGDSRIALQALNEANTRARRLGLRRLLGMSEEMRAIELRELGRGEEAAEIFARLASEETYGANPKDHARLLHNHAWSLLLAREAGELVEDPLPLLEGARQRFDTEAGRDDQRANVRLNLALAHLQAGRLAEATERLFEAKELMPEPPVHLRLWLLEIEARVALGRGHTAKALELYDRLHRLSTNAFDPGGRWRAFVGRARSHIARGQPTAARRALAEAEALLDEQSLQIPLDEGRETFMAQRAVSVRLYLDLLLAGGHTAEALDVARRSRARVLRALRYRDRLAQLTPAEQRRWEEAVGAYRRHRIELNAASVEEWRLSVDALARVQTSRAALRKNIARSLDRAFAVFGNDTAAPLPPARRGEVILTYHPLPQGWVGFVTVPSNADRAEVRAHRFELPAKMAGPEELAEVLLGPFEREILSAERLRILPYGILREVDFHALPFAGDVLLAGRPVVYGLDLLTAHASTGATPPRALLVVDPRGDLPAARREAESVRTALTAGPKPWPGSRTGSGHNTWPLAVLEGNAATSAEVAQQLTQVDLLHYAGHGVFSGRGGWESSLPLADNTRLTLGDLLSLNRSPRWVVLSGCETARTSSPGVLSLGLAHGFLLAGSHQVVAAVRPVGDRAAEGLFREFYLDFEATPDLAPRLQRAQLAWRRRGQGDWASFRVFEP